MTWNKRVNRDHPSFLWGFFKRHILIMACHIVDKCLFMRPPMYYSDLMSGYNYHLIITNVLISIYIDNAIVYICISKTSITGLRMLFYLAFLSIVFLGVFCLWLVIIIVIVIMILIIILYFIQLKTMNNGWVILTCW